MKSRCAGPRNHPLQRIYVKTYIWIWAVNILVHTIIDNGY